MGTRATYNINSSPTRRPRPICGRREALLREVVHNVTDQMREWGLGHASFARIIAELVIAGNALLTVGGRAPYTAVHGRVFRILPDISCQRAPDEQSPLVAGYFT